MFGGPPDSNGEAYNRFHRRMVNGDKIISELWYQEQVIIPMPDIQYKYYLFSINVTGGLGLFYSVIDMNQDSSRGAVSLKNIQMLSYPIDDGIIAVKHGNGRDWWLLARRSDTVNNEFYEFLISPSGISGPFILNAGSLVHGNIYSFSFSITGNKFVGFNLAGLIELFSFERCTGIIALDHTISPEATSAPYPYYNGAAFSPNEQLLYVSKYTDSIPNYPSYLIQFDLNAPNIFASADTIWSYFTTPIAGGAMRLAPDGKIYLTCAYSDGVHFNYPYPDSTFNTVNNNLSVINYPDSPGVACGFAPFSFNLGQGRCYWGLPNNPDYEMGAVLNSLCDTVTGIAAVGSGSRQEELYVFYHGGWQVAFINAEGLRGKNYLLSVFDLTGREVYKQEGLLVPPSGGRGYYTKDLNCAEFANGMYIVTLRTDREVLSKKFVKE